MNRETISVIFILILIVVGVYFLYSSYVKFLARIMVRSHKKKIGKGEITDEKLIKMYNRFKRGAGTGNVSYHVYGRGMSRMMEDIYKLYHEEMMRRNLL